jgi:hypothetical protein
MRDDGVASALASFDLPLDGWIVRLQPVMTSTGIDLFVLWQRTTSGSWELAVVELDEQRNPVGAPVALLPGAEIVATAGDTVLASPMDAQVKTAVIRGTDVGPTQVLSIVAARQIDPLLGSIGSRVIAAWTEAAADVRSTKAAILDADGARVSPVANVRGHALALASSGFDAVVVTRDADSIVATHFGADGTALRQSVIGSTSEPGVAGAAVWAGTHYVVAWFEGMRMKSVLLMPDGTASDVRAIDLPPPHPLLADATLYNTFALAFDGDDLLLAYVQEVPRPFQPGLRGPTMAVGIRMDRYATFADRESTLIDRDSPHGVALASSGNEIVAVTWNASRIVHALAIPRGRPLRVAARQILFEAVLAPRAAITWTGQDYAVAIAHVASRPHVALKFIDASLESTRTSRTVTSQTTGSPAVASTFTGEPVLAVSEMAAAGPAIAATYPARAMRELLPPPSAPSSSLIRRNAYQLLVSWSDPVHGPWDGFIIEASRTTFDVAVTSVLASVSPDVRQHSVFTPSFDATVSVRAFNEGGLSPPAPIGQSRVRTVKR